MAAVLGSAVLLAVPGSASAATFGPVTPYNVGPPGGPGSIVAGNLDAGGKLDLVAPLSYGRKVAVLLNKGDGTFKDQVQYDAAPAPSPGGASEAKAAGIADFNRDGKADIAVGWTATGPPPPPPPTAGWVAVLNGKGDGTFDAPTQTNAASNGTIRDLAVGDVNGDGRPDIVAVGSIPPTMVSPATGFVSILYDRPAGAGFDSTEMPVGSYVNRVVIADLDHDGKNDIAVVGGSSGGPIVTTLTHSAVGALVVKGSFPTGGPATGLAAGDVNGDGNLDFVTANDTADNLSVLLGKGDGTFKPKLDVPTGSQSGPIDVALSDVNGDGKLDVAAAFFAPSVNGDVAVLPGNGDGSFGAKQEIGVQTPLRLLTADLNADVRPDLAVAALESTSAKIKVLLNTTTAPPAAVTGAASAITTSAATLAGSVNGHGYGVSYHFDYGTTTAYGSKTPVVSGGGGALSVAAALTGLQAKTAYHYRVVASNAWGSATGSDVTFKTAALPCVVPKVVGKKLKTARAAITRARCKVGKIRKKYSRKVKKGRVISQSRRAGRHLAENAKVNLVVSKGRKPKRHR